MTVRHRLSYSAVENVVQGRDVGVSGVLMSTTHKFLSATVLDQPQQKWSLAILKLVMFGGGFQTGQET